MNEIIIFARVRRPLRRITALVATLFLTCAFALAASARELVPVGRAVGIRLQSEGVIVTAVPDMCADGVTPSPAKAADFRVGDIITHIDEREIASGEDLKGAIADEKSLAVQVIRGKDDITLNVTPCRSPDGLLNLGLMVRDGISGIGTVTYYDPATQNYGALGHAISDSGSNARLPVRGGEISRVDVSDVVRGKPGEPGQLHGSFNFEDPVGTITRNTEHGIFGVLNSGAMPLPKAVTVAPETEIHTGSVKIISNIQGSEVREYDAEISRVFRGAEADGRTMLITVTDPALIEAVGGIVQGMSGSPIIQEGRLVGAVTHVLINDPTKGYGISIDRMLDASDSPESVAA